MVMIFIEFRTQNVFQILKKDHNVKYDVEAHNSHAICKMHLAIAELEHPIFGNYSQVKTIGEKEPQNVTNK